MKSEYLFGLISLGTLGHAIGNVAYHIKGDFDPSDLGVLGISALEVIVSLVSGFYGLRARGLRNVREESDFNSFLTMGRSEQKYYLERECLKYQNNPFKRYPKTLQRKYNYYNSQSKQHKQIYKSLDELMKD